MKRRCAVPDDRKTDRSFCSRSVFLFIPCLRCFVRTCSAKATFLICGLVLQQKRVDHCVSSFPKTIDKSDIM